jgi:hypothetical protein
LVVYANILYRKERQEKFIKAGESGEPMFARKLAKYYRDGLHVFPL